MASIGRFTGLSKGRFADPRKTHGAASARTATSVPRDMRYNFTQDVKEDIVSDMLSFPQTSPKSAGLKKNTSFSQGESLIEASVSKHPQVELIDDCKGSTAYALNQHFAIVRHADRLDRTDDWGTYPEREAWPNDTPLSEIGHENAINTGLALKKSGKPFGLIIASPYLRCAQTASRIAQILKCPIQLDLDFGEVFDRSSMVGKITGPQHRDPEELEALLKADFPDVVYIRALDQKIKIEGTQQTFPESLDAARMRFCFKTQQVLQQAASKLMSTVVVTHGDALGAVIGMMQKDWKIKHVPYASFALASRQVMVLEKGSMETKSDEPVFDHKWDIEVSEGLEYEEVHPASRKRAYAVRQHEIKKMRANSNELETLYFSEKQVECFVKALTNLGQDVERCALLLKQAKKAPAFRCYSSVINEARVFDELDDELDEPPAAKMLTLKRHASA